jgi:hypothetical protein
MKRLIGRPPAFYLGILLAVSVLARVAAALYLGNTVQNLPGTTDQLSYHNLALRILGGYGFTFGENWWPATRAGSPTAHWSYLYTAFLTGIYALFGPNPLVARLIQAVAVGLLQPWLAYKLGGKLFNPTVGLVAAALTGLYAYFIYYSAALMTEAFYFCAVLGVLLLGIHWATRDPARLKFGAVLGLALTMLAAVLLRQLFLLFLPFLFLWILWMQRKHWLKVGLRLAAAGGLLVLLILPITYFNWARFNQFVLLNTNAGYAFFWANHPIYGTQFEPILSPEKGNYLQLLPKELKGLNEAELDTALLRRGLQFVADDPARYALLSLSRVPLYFSFWPSEDSSLISSLTRIFSFGIAWPFMLAGLILGVVRRKRSPGLGLPLLFVLVYTGIHVLSWVLVRYRLPVDAVLLPFAALALVEIAARLLKVTPQPRPEAAG